MLLPHAKQGDIWIAEFDPSVGDEIGKRRPAVVLSHPKVGILELRYVGPITDWKPRYLELPWFKELVPNNSNGLTKRSAADGFQCKSVSTERFIRQIGVVTNEVVEDIIDRLIFCVRK